MGKPTTWILVSLAALGGWYFFHEITPPAGSYAPPIATAGTGPSPHWPGPPSGSRNTHQFDKPIANYSPAPIGDIFPRDPRYLRIGSFDVEIDNRSKAEDRAVLHRLASIGAQFDVLAVQGISTTQNQSVGMILDILNSAGRHYEIALGPRVGRDANDQRQFAFLFDANRVEIDRHELYTVEDPDDLIRWEPLVGWFRAKGLPAQEAFTFTLVNVQTDPRERHRENSVLTSIFHEVRNDMRREDDVILVGNFAADAEDMPTETQNQDLQWAIRDLATNTKGTQMLDNILFSRTYTDEATGRAGIFDFLRELNLSIDEALAISYHLPVWAEFTIAEGGAHPQAPPRDDTPHAWNNEQFP